MRNKTVRPNMPQQKPRKNQNLRTAGKLSGLALQMGLVIYLGNLVGQWVAQKYEYKSAEEVITFAAIIVAIYMMIKQATTLNS